MENNSDFYIEQVNTQCLALFSYYIESEKEAIVIDPLRESEGMIKLAESRGAKIKYIFETHFHADFVSGHYELAEKTGATIVYGPTAKANFKFHEAKDNEDFKIGKITLRVLHTPGHTPESSSYLLLDANGKQIAVFTGDTLFLGEVGRPDLAVKGNEITEQDLAGWLYDSLRNKIMTLNDDVTVYPGHGAGSACGKKIQAGTYCTVGNQKKSNYALQDMTKEEFIKILTTGIAKPPAYFFHDVGLNKKGADKIEDILKKSLVPLKVDDVKKATSEGAWILDVRPFDDAKSKGRIPGSLNIQLAGTYAINTAILLKPDEKIIVVAPADKEKEAITRLSRVGYENVIGYLEGGFDAWVAGGNTTEGWSHVTPEDFVKTYSEAPLILDVRNRPELENEGGVDGSLVIPLGELHNRIAEVPKDKKVWVHCKLGGRSYMACSLLRHYGVDVVDCKGGMDGFKQAGFQAKTRVVQ